MKNTPFLSPNEHMKVLLTLAILAVLALTAIGSKAHADWIQRAVQFETLTFHKKPKNKGRADAIMPLGPDDYAAPYAQPTPSRSIFRWLSVFRYSKPRLDLLPHDLANPEEQIVSSRLALTYDSLSIEPSTGSIPIVSKVNMEKGSSLDMILHSLGINAEERRAAAKAIGKEFAIRKLQAGWDIRVGYNGAIPRGETGRLLSVSFDPTQFENITLSRGLDGFEVTVQKDEIAKITIRHEGVIKKGFWLDLQDEGLSEAMIVKVKNALDKRINVDKDIQPGAYYEFVMDVNIRENGQVTKSDGVLYASIEVGDLSKRGTQDLTKEIYYFKPPKARNGWYTPSARSVASGRTLLRLPAKGRISSHFNPRRKSPITGKISPHNGVDIAAPKGTPIVAAGDGKIVARKLYGGYGKFIEIDHGGGWKTRYAHLSSYKSGVTRGTFVRQGQIIGFVGSTGRSTGNHLHYEILKNGKARDPIRSSLPERVTLTGADKTAFNRFKNEIAKIRENAPLFGKDVFYKPETQTRRM